MISTAVGDFFSWPTDAVVIGASAGGIESLLALLERLPVGYQLPVIVLLHVPEAHESRLVDVFRPRLAVPVREATARAPVTPGTVYFAPNGYHLLVEADHTFSLSCDPPVLFSRPSIDVLMESCAHAYRAHLAGVVLTGANDDGARGLATVRAHGGLAVVQSPDEAAHATMPAAAIAHAGPQLVLPLAEIAALLVKLGAPR